MYDINVSYRRIILRRRYKTIRVARERDEIVHYNYVLKYQD